MTKQIEQQTSRKTGRWTEYKQTDRQPNTKTENQTDKRKRQTGKQINKHTERQTGKQTERTSALSARTE